MSLRIRQITEDGRQKCWKISEHETQVTFGTSRKASLSSIDSSLQSFEAVVERSGNNWNFINFAVGEQPAAQVIDQNLVINFKNSKLKFEIEKKNSSVLADLHRLTLPAGPVKKVMVIISNSGSMVETRLMNVGEKLEIMINGKIDSVSLPSTTEWQSAKLQHLDIQFRDVQIAENFELQKTETINVDDIKKQKPMIISMVTALSLVIISILFANINKSSIEKKVTSVSSTNIVLKTPLQKKQKMKSASASRASESKSDQSSGSSGNKASAAVKAAVGIRISQLLGKVSATEARTKNVIVAAQGIKAGEGPSGRALAALGKAEASGRNWNGESVGKGAGVSTAGFGGGKGTSQFGGGLGQGKTGSGGVGLIEEESEIVGGLDREVIAQYIKTQLGQILYCYERQLSASPELYGKIAVKFTIAGTGQVETQTINDTTLKNKSVENCVLSKVAKWKFPEPKGGTKVVVTYPFLFKSTN